MKKNESFEDQIAKLSIFPPLILLLLLIWTMVVAQFSIYPILLITFISSIVIGYCNITINRKIYYQFRSVSNLLEAMIHGDYTLRAKSNSRETINSAYNELSLAINLLADRLANQRLEVIDSQKLLKMVINFIDVAILTVDSQNQVSLMNPAAHSLFSNSRDQERLHQFLSSIPKVQNKSKGVIELCVSQNRGKFSIHVEEFLEKGHRCKLIFVTDVSTILREEERNAWKSLVRVISHEINNSLSPISSIAQTLSKAIANKKTVEDSYQIIEEGLNIIAERSCSLKTFVDSYRQIAQLAKPVKKQTSVLALVEKSCALFTSVKIIYSKEEDFLIDIDSIQIEQVLINLIKNAIEATDPEDPICEISITWKVTSDQFVLVVCDRGIGISNTENLFVPFYTTKKQGSGIGLALCRQILDGHNGTLTLTNRKDVRGCSAVIEIKL